MHWKVQTILATFWVVGILSIPCNLLVAASIFFFILRFFCVLLLLFPVLILV